MATSGESFTREAPRADIWLPGGAPSPGRVARAALRGMDDLRELEKLPPEALLPALTIHDALAAAATWEPEKPAIIQLVSADPSVPAREICYRELADLVARSANLFAELSADAPVSVAILLPMVPEALIASWAGSTYGITTPINPFFEPGIVVSIMNTVRATVLVTTKGKHGPGAWDKLDAATLAQAPSLRAVLYVDGDDPEVEFLPRARATSPTPVRDPVSNPDADATYLLTGGTTGAPKLIRMTHRGQLINAWMNGVLQGMQASGVMGHAMPNFHVGGAVVISVRTMLFGQTLLTLTTGGFRNQDVVRNFWKIARKFRMTCVLATPTTAAAILALPETETSDGHRITAFGCGGSTIPLELLKGFHARYGIWLREQWGMSEGTGTITGHYDNGEQPVTGSVGQRLPYHFVKAIEVDEENRFVRDCAPGERGVIAISGAGMAPGYVDASLDAGYFVAGMPDGLVWGNTGDLGAVDEDGYVWIFGRAKDTIIRGGHNIDPKLIEEVLVCHPAVQLAAAIGLPDRAKGEMPIAYVQLKEGAHATAADLMALCRANVQERAALPVRIEIVRMLPTTPVGKISKPALRVLTLESLAREIAEREIGADGAFTLAVDESGKRPGVALRVSARPGAADAVRARLELGYFGYEFAVSMEVA